MNHTVSDIQHTANVQYCCANTKQKYQQTTSGQHGNAHEITIYVKKCETNNYMQNSKQITQCLLKWLQQQIEVHGNETQVCANN